MHSGEQFDFVPRGLGIPPCRLYDFEGRMEAETGSIRVIRVIEGAAENPRAY